MDKAKRAWKLLLFAALMILSLGCFATSASAASTEVKALAKGKTYSVTGYYKVTSSKTTVATVKKNSSKDYTVTAVKRGKTTLNCYNKNGTLKKQIYLLVTNSNSFVYNTKTIILEKGNTKKAKASTNFLSGVSIRYVSSDKNVATVSSSGKITAVNAGTAIIKAKFYYKGTRVKTLKKTVNVYTSSYNTSTISMAEGEVIKVKASVSGNCTAAYSSSDKSVAKVTSKGKITAVKTGSATITCKVSLGDKLVKTYTKKVKVTSSMGQQIAEYALQYVGRPYVWAGTDLWNGSDCSGFTMKVFEQFGISLPHFAEYQRTGLYCSPKGTSITPNTSSLQPGDLVFYGEPGYADHVMIYIGNGQVVGARGTAYGVTVERYNYRTPIGARRFWS